jgi:hypothetical protein
MLIIRWHSMNTNKIISVDIHMDIGIMKTTQIIHK